MSFCASHPCNRRFSSFPDVVPTYIALAVWLLRSIHTWPAAHCCSEPPVEWSTGAVTVGKAYLLSGPFGCRCLTSLSLAPFPALPHQTGHDHLGHPAFRQHSL